MSLQMKLIIPLLDDEITKEDISPEAGFIDAYNYDINRPSLEDCIFLMYDETCRTDAANKRYYKFSKLKTIRSRKTICVNKHPYIIYTFVVTNTDLHNLLKGMRHTKTASYTRFVQFWSASDGMVNRYVLFPMTDFNYERHSVPEADYQYTLEDVREEQNKGEFCIPQSPPFVFLLCNSSRLNTT